MGSGIRVSGLGSRVVSKEAGGRTAALSVEEVVRVDEHGVLSGQFVSKGPCSI